MGKSGGIRPQRPIALLVTICFTAVLLPVLAYLQYRWIGEVSQAAKQRMQAQLERDLDSFTRDFDEQIRRIGLRNGPQQWRPESGRPAEDVVKRWAANLTVQPMIKDAYLVRRAGRSDSVKHFNWTDGTLTAVPMPAELSALVASLQANRGGTDEQLPAHAMPIAPTTRASGRGPPRLGPGQDGPPRGGPPNHPPPHRPPSGQPLDDNPPPNDEQFGPGPPQALQAADHWLVVVFDVGYFQKIQLPAMLRQSLGASDYLIRITGPAGLIYRNAEFDGGDAHRRLFPIPRSAPEDNPRGGGDRIWRITVRNRAGSLEEVVARTQRRDLFTSFGIFCVLAVSIGSLVVLTRRAGKLARMQMEFVAGVSHELRTPLAVVNSAADNLAAGIVQPDSVRRYGDLIRKETRRLARMVEDVLAFSGIEHSHKPRHPQPVDLAIAIEQALAACAPEVEQSGCRVVKDIDPDLPPVIGDSGWLEQCVRNLVGNATKYAASGKWIGISAKQQNGFVFLRVADRGPGIEPSDLKKIFEPFYRARSVMEAQIEGSGIGLSVVKRIVEAHDGTVTVESHPGKGCTFTVRLPVEFKNEDV